MKPDLGEKFESVILDATGASAMRLDSVIQELWSGYGQILRVALSGDQCERKTVVVKHVMMPMDSRHPRGSAAPEFDGRDSLSLLLLCDL